MRFLFKMLEMYMRNLNNLLGILNSKTLYDSNSYKRALFKDRPQ